jgi:hypothetical protein
MNMSVQCAEEIPFSTLQDTMLAAQVVQPQIAAFYTIQRKTLFAACQTWNPLPPDGAKVCSDQRPASFAGRRV